MAGSRAGGLMATLLVSSALAAGCGRGSQEWSADGPVRYCVDQAGRRVPDSQCAPAHAGGVSPFLWYYLGSLNARNSYVPPVGGFASGGGYAPATGVRYGAPVFGTAGAVARGGFGGTAAGLGAGE